MMIKYKIPGVDNVNIILSLAAIIIAILFIPSLTNAQNVSLAGTVVESGTGQAIEGVQLAIVELDRRVTTDEFGRYKFRRMVPGDYLIRVTAPGFTSKEIQLKLDEDQVHYIEMQSNVSDSSYIKTYVDQGKNRAITRQYNSYNFTQIISSEHIQLFGDNNLEEILARLTGIQMGQGGYFNARGVTNLERGIYNMTVNGQRLATTGLGTRSLNPGILTSDMVHQVEMIKVLTPEMNADAPGGLINIDARRPAGHDRHVDFRYSGGLHTGNRNLVEPENRVAVNYSEILSDAHSLSAGLSYHRDNIAWENLGVDYDLADFGSGYVDVIESISSGFHLNERKRFNSYLDFKYQPDEVSSYFINGFISNGTDNFSRRTLKKSSNSNWINQHQTGNDGDLGYNTYFQDAQYQQMMAQAGAKHMFDLLDLEYRAGWSYGNIDQEDLLMPFLWERLEYEFDLSEFNRPVMNLTGNNQLQRRDLRIRTMNKTMQEHEDHTFTGNMDVTIPAFSGYVKTGAGAIRSYKSGAYLNSTYRALALMDLSRFQLESSSSYDVLGESRYEIPWMISTNGARDYFNNNITSFQREPRLEHERSDIWNYELREDIYSGYAMGHFNIGALRVLGGIRLEYTTGRFQGYDVLFDHIGGYVGTEDSTQSRSYYNIFPNAQMQYEAAENTHLKLAYSRSIARPDFYQITPFRLQHIQNETIFKGNTDLKPLVSDNFDLGIEKYFPDYQGYISIGFYYKNLKNFIFESNQIIEAGEFEGFHERTYRNGDETASIYGMEITLQNKLGFLPGFLGNFSIYANYSLSESSFEINNRDDEVRLPMQSPHVVNSAISYIQGRFMGQISYHWTSKYVEHLSEGQNLAPFVSSEIYRDVYKDGFTDLSASVRVRLSDNFILLADATNLMSSERVQFVHSRSTYAHNTSLSKFGVFRLGLRFML